MTDKIRENDRYEFADFRLETGKQVLFCKDAEIHLPKRHFQILTYLIENRDRVVTRDELLNEFWDGHEVYDDALSKCVGALRRVLDDKERAPRFIETRRGTGYRFIGEIGASESLNVGTVLDTSNALAADQTLSAVKLPFWRSRIILISSLAVITLLSVSFVVGVYLPRQEQPSRQKLSGIGSIAVLPLRNLTGDTANDYLSDGLSEGLINEFSRHSELKVISRSASFTFKNKEIDLQEVRDKLKVEAILEGSLRKIGDEMRIEVSLVDVKDGKVLWTNNDPTSSVRNFFTLQNQIACDVLTRIEAGSCIKVETAKNIDAEAYRLYLQGIHIRNDLTFEAMTKAVELFDKALSIAPNFAKAHEGIATTYVIMESNSLVPPGSVIKKAESHAREALRLDENSVDALLVLSETETSDNYDMARRESILRQAVDKNPNFGRSRMWLASTLAMRGKFAEAESELLKLQESDPLSSGVQFTLSELYLNWRKPDEAIRTANLVHDLKAPDSISDRLLAKAYLQKGDLDQVKTLLDKKPDNYESLHATWLIRTGKVAEAAAEIKKLEVTETGKTSPFVIAYLYAELGDKDAAFRWLERSYAMRQSDLASLKIEPALDSLRGDARYVELIKRLHLDN
ncbi:MAG TPA: winged helix-turn-helix domain-containing protein [Pyrinomonadaceae bacterium]|nr:winged helix-turn-helix domain-containing protein [Acidobacteriota bacterium]HQZ97994.1 winged helix-turn-helix domain-containing protein [Pyrinomonadaceae bacterium]